MAVHLFGIRHHGPGSARALLAALEELQPDCVLVEGPPDAQDVLPLILHEHLVPPVALLVYRDDRPARAVYYPFTHFSPEWQSLRYGLARGIPTRFFDLPQALQLGKEAEPEGAPKDISSSRRRRALKHGDDTPEPGSVAVETPDEEPDPLALLALAAGYHDHELWWEHQIEQRQDATGLFAAIHEAMTALRFDREPCDETERQREAYMRQQIRAATAAGYASIAVVCGAWHTPALTSTEGAETDATLLKGLKPVKVTATWIPWTNSRLAFRSGYGAGVRSPGWYAHLWNTSQQRTVRWLAHVAQTLREAGFDAPSASVIEAVRLAETLAALRDLPVVGLAELHEATLTVLCHGAEAPLQIVRDRLEIGEALGEVPPDAPTVPLQRDLEARQRQLRLKPSPDPKALDLDLREPAGLAKSQFFHQLALLDITWGKPTQRGGYAQGTFHEVWKLQWQPELAVKIVEANIWGNTVESAATASVTHQAVVAGDLPTLTGLLQRVILADLASAVDGVLERVHAQSAIAADLQQLMHALTPLAQVARYSDVRRTRTEDISAVIAGLFARIIIGLRPACMALNDEAAETIVEGIEAVDDVVRLLEDPLQRQEWQQSLHSLLDDEAIHGLIRGRATRILLEQQVLAEDELERLARHALSPVVPPMEASAWASGVLRGGTELLLHEDALWRALDRWLAALSPEIFIALLPLLRRAFSQFDRSIRQRMGEKVKHLRTAMPGATIGPLATELRIDRNRADRVLPALAHLLGVKS